jgi:oxygen-independent coproporphyrinogen-3 oxidase
MSRPLQTLAELGPTYQDYAYGYPHKTAYRGFDPAIALRSIWADEPKSSLFLYVHLPFCEMRCGFCNLFTTANAKEDRIDAYLAALMREMTATREEIGPVHVAQMAIGGGTPTLLGAARLDALFSQLEQRFGASGRRIPLAIETSPLTATADTIRLLDEWGTGRISIGVQSFDAAETKAMGRPQDGQQVRDALDTIRRHARAALNIDLIYGATNQTADSFCQSILEALRWNPEELYLYPLYVRRGTGLDGKSQVEDQHRQRLYRAGRDLLLDRGYHQTSMRAFRRDQAAGASEFSCQEDGVIGLGAGARSYTAGHHYATDYAVGRSGVLSILDDYAARDTDQFRSAWHGIAIDTDERARRFILKSILRTDGLTIADFVRLFGADPCALFPRLFDLISLGLLTHDDLAIVPTTLGLEYSDAIPPLFYSDAVRDAMGHGVTR